MILEASLMKAIEIEVVSTHYIGKLEIEPAEADHSIFGVYQHKIFVGYMHPIKTDQGGLVWYSKEITDKELVADIGEWIIFHFHVNTDGHKKHSGFRLGLPAIFKRRRPG